MTPEEIAEARQKRYNATVVGLRKANPELMILRVRPDFVLPDHHPGQYSTLGLGNWEPRFPGSQDEEMKPEDESKLVRRAYSISCPILGDDGKTWDNTGLNWLEFYVVLVRESEPGKRPPALTPRLFMLRNGDRLNMGEKIAGEFTLEGVKPEDTILFLSTGTGEAPHNYMLWQLLKAGHPGKILSACCVRYKRDLGYLDVHESIAKRHSNYQYLPLTTRESIADGRKVYIQDLITSGQLEQQLGEPLDPKKTHVYLCGNPKMIGIPEVNNETGEREYPRPPGVIEILERRGFSVDDRRSRHRGNIHYEKYW